MKNDWELPGVRAYVARRKELASAMKAAINLEGIPKEVREEYLKMILDEVDPFSIVASDGIIYGRRCGVSYELKNTSDFTSLEIGHCSFNGNNQGVEIRELGVFRTMPDIFGDLETTLSVGSNFIYHGGYDANHSISRIYDILQASEIIPHIQTRSLSMAL